MHLLGPESPVVADGEGVEGEGIQDDGRVQKVLLKVLEPHVEPLKPHQVSHV